MLNVGPAFVEIFLNSTRAAYIKLRNDRRRSHCSVIVVSACYFLLVRLSSGCVFVFGFHYIQLFIQYTLWNTVSFNDFTTVFRSGLI